jgi:choline dehydrogenase-like flavoprotein
MVFSRIVIGHDHEEIARHSLDFWLQSKDLPNPNNRIKLNTKDQIIIHYQANNLEAHKRLLTELKSLLKYIGCHEHLIPVEHYLGRRQPFNLARQMGTLRMGTDARILVLDTWCRPHELDNVYVTDGSFLFLQVQRT